MVSTANTASHESDDASFREDTASMCLNVRTGDDAPIGEFIDTAPVQRDHGNVVTCVAAAAAAHRGCEM
jgi:hypothetical protein